MSFWTDLRDTGETAAVLAGNYFYPGSSMVTSKLVSNGSQEQLNSDAGKLAQLGSGGYGGMEGNLANWGNPSGAFGGGNVNGLDIGGSGAGANSWMGGGEYGDTGAVSGLDLGGAGSSPATLSKGVDRMSLASKGLDAFGKGQKQGGANGAYGAQKLDIIRQGNPFTFPNQQPIESWDETKANKRLAEMLRTMNESKVDEFGNAVD